MARSEFNTTFIPPFAGSPERMFNGIDGTDFSFSGIENASTFTEYKNNYVIPYAQHLSRVDGIKVVRLPMSWLVWEKSSATYKTRLGEYLEVLREAGLKVQPVVWSNKTNLSGLFYPLLTMAQTAFDGVDTEACVDRDIFEWADGQNGKDTDKFFETTGVYTYHTGSYITLSASAGYSSLGGHAIIDPGNGTYDINGVTPFISPLYSSDLQLPGDVPAQFCAHVKHDGGGDGDFVFKVTTVATASATYYWTGKEWSLTPTTLDRTASDEWRFESIWFETTAGSLDGTYDLSLEFPAAGASVYNVDQLELYLPGSEPDVHNYFNPRNTASEVFESDLELLPSATGWKGSNAITSELYAPFNANRVPVQLPNPGTYRISNYEEFFTSTFTDIASPSLNNLDVNGASAYLADILSELNSEVTEGLSIDSIDVFEHPFSTSRPMFSPRESNCFIRFIQKTIDTIKNDGNYTGAPLALNGKSVDIFNAPEVLQASSGPRFKSFIWVNHRTHPVTGVKQHGMDTGSSLTEYNVFFPDISGETQPIPTDFDYSLYQVIDESDSTDLCTEYNLKYWNSLDLNILNPSVSSSLPDEPVYNLKNSWVDIVLPEITYIGVYGGFDPSRSAFGLNGEYPGNIPKILGLVEPWASSTESITVSITDAGFLSATDDYYNREPWSFASTWNNDYRNTDTPVSAGPDTTGVYVSPNTTLSSQYTPIFLPEPLTNELLTYDATRGGVVYSGRDLTVSGEAFNASSEYRSFAGYTLASDGSRVYPNRSVIPLQFDSNRSLIYGGIAGTSLFGTDSQFVTRQLVNVKGDIIDIGWSAIDLDTSIIYNLEGSNEIKVFNYEDLQGSLGLVNDLTTYSVNIPEGTTRVFKVSQKDKLAYQTGDDWDHIWSMLPDFWTKHFEDMDAISAMWSGVADVASNFLGHLYQYDLAKGIHTTPHKVIGSNDAMPFEDGSFSTESTYTFKDGSTASDDYYVSDTIKEIPQLRWGFEDTADVYNQGKDFEVEDGIIHFRDGLLSTSSITTLFAPWISYDESLIYKNYGHYLDLDKEESQEYKQSVVAGLYGLWNGHTINVFKVICDALAGFPLIPYRGKVKFVSTTSTTFSIIVEDQFGNERTISIPALFAPSVERPIVVRTGLKTEVTITNTRDLVGLEMFSLAPATSAFTVYDRVSDEEKMQSLATVFKDRSIGLYHHIIGELDATSIDKLGDQYESLGWGSREQMFEEIASLIEKIKGQHTLFQLIVSKRPIETTFLKEPDLDVVSELKIEPTLDHNMVNHGWSSGEWLPMSQDIEPVTTVSEAALNATKIFPTKGRLHGHVRSGSEESDPTVAQRNSYASLGPNSLVEKSLSGVSIGFNRIRAAVSKIFKFKPKFKAADQERITTTGSYNYAINVEDSNNFGFDDLISSYASDSSQRMFAMNGPHGSGTWSITLEGDTGVETYNDYMEYPPDSVDDVQIRTELGYSTLSTVSTSKGLTVLARVKPRSAGTILELSGTLDLSTTGSPIVGACCVGSGSYCSPCTQSFISLNGFANGGGCYPDYSCVSDVTSQECSALGGEWLGAATTCAGSPCSLAKGRCCAEGEHYDQLPGHCDTPHECVDVWHKAYCECMDTKAPYNDHDTAVFTTGSDCSTPCCTEESPSEVLSWDAEVVEVPAGGGDAYVNESYTESITITNTGNVQQAGYVYFDTASSTEFSFGSDTTGYTTNAGGTGYPGVLFNLVEGADKTLIIHFDPTVSGVQERSLKLMNLVGGTHESNHSEPLAVSSDVQGPIMDMDITTSGTQFGYPLDLGAHTFGDPDSTASVQIQNVGGGTLEGTLSVSGLSYFSVLGGNEFSMARNETASFVISYTPENGDFARAETIELYDTSSTQVGEIYVSAESGTPGVTCLNDVTNLDFGTITASDTSDLVFNLTNSSSSTDTISGLVTVTGDPSFTIITAASYTLPPGTSKAFTIRFTGPVSAGTYLGTVDIGNASCPNISCIGTVRDATTDISITALSNNFDMVTRTKDKAKSPIATITNTGETTVSVDVSSSAPFDLELVGTGTTASLAPAAAIDVEGTFSAAAFGVYQDIITPVSAVSKKKFTVTGASIHRDGKELTAFPNITHVDATTTSGTYSMACSSSIIHNLSGTLAVTPGPGSAADFTINDPTDRFSLAQGDSITVSYDFVDTLAGVPQYAFIHDTYATLSAFANITYMQPGIIVANNASPDVTSDFPSYEIGPVPAGVNSDITINIYNADQGSAYTDDLKIDRFSGDSISIISPGTLTSVTTPIATGAGLGDRGQMSITIRVNSAFAGTYYAVLEYGEGMIPISIKFTVTDGAAPTDTGPNGSCACCLNIGTDYVYCDDSLSYANCVAAGGTPNMVGCVSYGSMGTVKRKK